jgi:hypothetical protein
MPSSVSDIVKPNPATPAPPYYVKGLALGIPALLLGLQISGWIFFIPVITHGHFDFRQLYTGGYMLRSRHARELYDYDAQKTFQDALISREQIALPFNHLAYEALLFAPFSLLPFRTAYSAFLALNLALLTLSFRLLRPRMGNLARVWRWLPVAMFLGFLPLAAALMQGQDSILLLTLLAAAMVSVDRGWELTAGVLVGLGLFKFQIAVPMALLFLAWRRWRFSAGFALSAAVVGSGSLWLVGLSQAEVYVRSLFSMSVALNSPLDQFRYGISPVAMPNLRGLIFGLAASRLPPFWVQVGTVAASAVLLLMAAALTSNKQRGAKEEFSIAITVSTLVSYHLLIHDLSVLLVPIALTLNRFIEAEATGDRGGRLIARASALMFAAPACMSFIPFHFYVVSLPLLAFLLAIATVSRGYQPLAGDAVR